MLAGFQRLNLAIGPEAIQAIQRYFDRISVTIKSEYVVHHPNAYCSILADGTICAHKNHRRCECLEDVVAMFGPWAIHFTM